MITSCLVCQKDIKTEPGRVKKGLGKYCSREHYFLTIRGKKGKPSPHKGKHWTAFEKNCLICEKKFLTTPIRISKGQGKYCSRDCYYKSEKGISTWNKGKHWSEEWKRKMSMDFKGRTFNTGRTHFKKGSMIGHKWQQGELPWNTGLEGDPRCLYAGKKAWEANRDRGFSNRVGKRHSLNTRIQISAKKRNIEIETWNGFTMPINHSLRNLPEYKIWQNFCMKRDDYTCLICKKRGIKLHVDHIIAFSILVSEAIKIYGNDLEQVRRYQKLWDISNGRTLCISCHKNTENWGWKAYHQLNKINFV